MNIGARGIVQRSVLYYGRYAVIAGASEGVGLAFARLLCAAGLDLVLIARSEDKLASIASELRRDYADRDVRILVADLGREEAIHKIVTATFELDVGMFIYTAGAETGPHTEFVEAGVERIRYQIALNIVVPATLAQHFGKRFKFKGRGGLILVGSLSGYSGSPGNGVYSASKAFIHTLTEGMWIELRPYHVHVLGLVLGLTRTPALMRSHPQVDLTSAADPDQIVKDALDNLAEGPIWFPAGLETAASEFLRLPRKAVVEAKQKMMQAFKGNNGRAT